MRVKFLKPYRLRVTPIGPVVDAKPGDILDDHDHPGSTLPGLVREGAAVLALDGEHGEVDPRTCLSGESVLGAGLAAMLAHAENTLSVAIPAEALEELPQWLKAPVLLGLAELRRKGSKDMDLRQLVQAASAAALEGQQGPPGAPGAPSIPEVDPTAFQGSQEEAEALATKLNDAPPADKPKRGRK